VFGPYGQLFYHIPPTDVPRAPRDTSRRRVTQGCKQVRCQIANFGQTSSRPNQSHKHILHGILGVLATAQHTHRCPMEPCAEPLAQQRKSPLVPGNKTD
jgi:hypothetical protein